MPESVFLNKYHFLNIEKIVQTFSYIQQKAETTNKIELIKYLFFADRINVRKHFSLISQDRYVVLKHGPAGLTALNILNKYKNYLDNFSPWELTYLDKIQKINGISRIIEKMDHDLLSKNEINSLNLAVQIFNAKAIVEISHDYPEWKRFKPLFKNQAISFDFVNSDDFFSNPNIEQSPAINKYFNGIDPLYEEPECLAEAKEFYHQFNGGRYGL